MGLVIMVLLLSSPQGCHYVEEGGPHSPCDQVCKSCSDPESGARWPSGATWGNCTASRACFSGVVTESTVECPAPMCAHPVTLQGHCCPSCPTKKVRNQEVRARVGILHKSPVGMVIRISLCVWASAFAIS